MFGEDELGACEPLSHVDLEPPDAGGQVVQAIDDAIRPGAERG